MDDAYNDILKRPEKPHTCNLKLTMNFMMILKRCMTEVLSWLNLCMSTMAFLEIDVCSEIKQFLSQWVSKPFIAQKLHLKFPDSQLCNFTFL